MRYKYLILMLCVVFLIGSVSAFSLNIKSFDKDIGNYGKYEIKNWLGTNLKDIELLENSFQCNGDECYAIKEIKLYNNDSLIDQVRFYKNTTSGWEETNIRNYNIYIKSGENIISINDYGLVNIGTLPNGTIIYENQIIGTHNEIEDIWSDYTLGTIMPKDNYTVKLEGEKKSSWTVDWQIKTNGRWLDDWAIWGANTGNLTRAHGVSITSDAIQATYYGMRVNYTGSDPYYISSSTAVSGAGCDFTRITFANGTLITTSGITSQAQGGIMTFVNNYTLYPNLIYRVECNTPSGDRKFAAGSFPVTSNGDFIWVDGSEGGGDDASWNNILSVNISSVTQGTIYLNSPIDIYNSSSANNLFNATANLTGGSTIVNMSLITNETGSWTIQNTTDGLSSAKETQTWNRTLSDGVYLWGIKACDSDGDCGYSDSNRTIIIDTVGPSISITSPNETFEFLSIGDTLRLNTTISDSTLDSCWYDYNGTNLSFSCSSGVQQNLTIIQEADNFNVSVWANDSIGRYTRAISTWDYKIFENNNSYLQTTTETEYQTFNLNVTANSSLTAVTLDYNGTGYAMTSSGGIWTKTLNTPLGTTNRTLKYNFTYAGSAISSNYFYQNISELVFTLCNSTYSADFLNITFKDEDDLTYINASIPTSTFTYYLDNQTSNKTYSYTNSSNNYNYTFCASPSTETIKVLPYIQYKQGTTYPQRIYNPSVQTYNNTITNKTLYLLGSSDGIYVTFQVINSADQTLSGVAINATRVIGAETIVVATGTTSATGTVTFWLNPDIEHTFAFSRSGYTGYSYSDFPTQASYTITLGGGAQLPVGYTKGILYKIYPTNKSLINNSIYAFGFNVTSSYWDLQEYGFDLRLNNGTTISSSTTSVSGTLITLNLNTTNLTRVYMDYYWLINSTYSNGTISWMVYNTDNTQWSIKTFFTDFNTYFDSGLFGLDNFGRYLIVFLILFLSVGILGYKYGLTNPIFVTGLLFFIVLFLDVGIGLIPDITVMNGNSIPNLLTFITGFIFVVSIISEVSRR